jgi:gustatory receptor
LTCDDILKESHTVSGLASQLQALGPGLTPLENKEFKMFVTFVEHNRPRFKAARFFSLDRSTLLQILNSLITFLLVAIQFK